LFPVYFVDGSRGWSATINGWFFMETEVAMVHGRTIYLESTGFSDIIDITATVRGVVAESGVGEGIVNVFCPGSTASVSTIEFEPALVEDVRDYLEHLIPGNVPTRHGKTWGDDNGFSHIRATLMGPQMTAPVVDGELLLGTWQQIVVIDHDNKPRRRTVRIQVVGE
jgi:secondary thiamine-phosphate synthase enzyme